jgi:hypothetical protein
MTNAKAGCCAAAFSGLVGGSWVGAGVIFVGAPWKMAALCPMLGVAIGTFLYKEDEGTPLNRSLFELFRIGRCLTIPFRLFFSSLFIMTICVVYSGSDEIPLYIAFGLFLLPIIPAVLLFGALFAYIIPVFSSLAFLYFAIPPRNSFAIETIHDLLTLCLFVSLAWVTWATLTLQSIFSGVEDG